jgi:hypothetical protein
MKHLLVFLSAIFMVSCSGTKKVSDRLPEIPQTRFDRKYYPNLPYREIVKTIHANRSIKSNNYDEINKFKNYTYEINSVVLEAVMDIGNIPTSKRTKIEKKFTEECVELDNEIYSDYVNEIHTTKYLPQKNLLINYNVSLSVDAFSNVLSSKICTIVGLAITISGIPKLYSISSTLFCEELLSNLLMPILEELKNQALILDYVNAEIKITEHIRELIIELATVQDRFRADYKGEQVRQIIFKSWKSTAELKMKVTATIKAGFDLKEYFDIKFSESEKTLTIYLPKAKILSEDFDYSITDITDGWFIEIDKNHINSAMIEMKRRLRNEALQSGILIRAESHAEMIISSLLEPIMENKYVSFKTKVVFVN